MHRKGSADLQGVWPDFFLIHPSINLSILFNLSLSWGLERIPATISGEAEYTLGSSYWFTCKRAFLCILFTQTKKQENSYHSIILLSIFLFMESLIQSNSLFKKHFNWGQVRPQPVRKTQPGHFVPTPHSEWKTCNLCVCWWLKFTHSGFSKVTFSVNLGIYLYYSAVASICTVEWSVLWLVCVTKCWKTLETTGLITMHFYRLRKHGRALKSLWTNVGF